jgi:transcriptional regulator with AbiEi antitoxin domain of type IV toxin-antitoxin system
MTIQKPTKLNQLLRDWPSNAIFLAGYLRQKGYSNQLLARYKQGKWLRSVGRGAYVKQDDRITLEGALYALQTQAGLSVHQGARHALSLLGKAHYIEMREQKVELFGNPKEELPTWFKNLDWGQRQVKYYKSSFLPPELGLETLEIKHLKLKVSSSTRAIMECLYLAPGKQDLMECMELMEGLNNLRPKVVQYLLENCQSVKVKRLFLYFSEKLGHAWYNRLDIERLDLGRGKRSIVPNGVFNAKYQITIPAEIESYDISTL